jgi:cytochrome b561
MRLIDTRNGYGWISILLHWFTAGAVGTLWFVGNSTQVPDVAEHDRLVRLHTSIAISVYLFLWLRIIWRFAFGHPGPLPKQGRFFFAIGKYLHLALLAAIGSMLLTGPLMVWFGGDAIHVFDWFEIPSPLPADMALHDLMHTIHELSAAFIVLGTLLHLAGAFKHSAFNQDGTFDKMMIASRESDDR